MKSGKLGLAIVCAMLVVVAAAACDAGTTTPVDREKTNAPFLVSNAGAGVAAIVAADESGSQTAVMAPGAFISLPPGSFPNGTVASLRSPGGASATVPMVDGGFDPVRIPAGAADIITISITLSQGGSHVFTVSVPPKAPPRIVRTTPVPFKRDVVFNARLMVVFTEPLHASAVTQSRVTLQTGGTAVTGTLGFVDADHTTIEFVPAEPLAPSRDYELIVSAAVTDLDGSAIESAMTIAFRTQAPPPQLGLVISNPRAGSLSANPMNPEIQLWFSEDVDRLSLFTQAGHPRVYLMHGADTVPGSVVCEPTTGTRCTSLRYLPVNLLMADTDYRLIVADGVRGADGAILMQALLIPFRTHSRPSAAALLQLSGDRQVTITGTAFPQPLVVRAVDAQGIPVAGVPVTFTPRAGTGGSTTAVTNDQGLATRSWLADLAGVQFMNATAPGLPALFFTGTTASCAPKPLELGATVSGVIDYFYPCALPAHSEKGDAYRITLAQQQVFTLSTTGDVFHYLTDSNALTGQSVFRFNSFGVTQNTFVLPAGEYTLTASVDAYDGGSYSLTTIPRAPTFSNGCTPDSPLKTIPGVVITGSIDQTDCNAVTGRYDDFLVSLKAGATITASATSSAGTILTVHTSFTQPSTAPSLSFTAPGDGTYTVRLYNPSPAATPITYAIEIKR